MNTVYVLIIIMTGWFQSGVAATTQEFTSKENCVTAGELIKKSSDKAHEVHTYCVEK